MSGRVDFEALARLPLAVHPWHRNAARDTMTTKTRDGHAYFAGRLDTWDRSYFKEGLLDPRRDVWDNRRRVRT